MFERKGRLREYLYSEFLLPALRHGKGNFWLSFWRERGEAPAGRLLTLFWYVVVGTLVTCAADYLFVLFRSSPRCLGGRQSD
jgi:hypothetical protein